MKKMFYILALALALDVASTAPANAQYYKSITVTGAIINTGTANSGNGLITNKDGDTCQIYCEGDSTVIVATHQISVNSNIDFNDSVRIRANAGAGKVLTSDAKGFATWQTAGGGGASNAINGLHTNGDTILAGGEIIRTTQMLRTVGAKYNGLKFGDNLNGFVSNSTFLTQYDTLNQYYNVAGVGDLSGVGASAYTSIFGLVSLDHDTQTLVMAGPDNYNLSIKHNGQAQYQFEATHNTVSSYVRSGSNYYGFGADSTAAYWRAGTATIKLPSSAGTTGQVLTTNGTDQASWTTVGGGGASPGGDESNLQVKYNGTFWGSDALKFDSTFSKLSVGEFVGTPLGYVEVPVINTQTVNFFNPGGGGNTFSLSFDASGPGGMFLPNGYGEAGQFIINQGTGAHTAWKDFRFASKDSASIYVVGAWADGTTFYCTDCSGDGITGRIVSYIGAAWRRLKFD